MDSDGAERQLNIHLDPENLAGVYANGHEHTWTLTLHGTTQSHSTFLAFGVKRVTEIHATSFDLEFSGPDAATLNGSVSEHLAPEVREVLTVDGAIASRDGIGGTARSAVDVQLDSLDARLARLTAR